MPPHSLEVQDEGRPSKAGKDVLPMRAGVNGWEPLSRMRETYHNASSIIINLYDSIRWRPLGLTYRKSSRGPRALLVENGIGRTSIRDPELWRRRDPSRREGSDVNPWPPNQRPARSPIQLGQCSRSLVPLGNMGAVRYTYCEGIRIVLDAVQYLNRDAETVRRSHRCHPPTQLSSSSF